MSRAKEPADSARELTRHGRLTPLPFDGDGVRRAWTSEDCPVMGAYYDEIEIEDMVWDEEKGVFHYPCPCGDRFEISRKQLANYEDIATCPSCSLIIRVVYDPVTGYFLTGYNRF